MKTNRHKFIQILKTVAPALAGKEVIEQTNSFIFNKGVLFTYNDEIAISHPLPAEFDLEGAVIAKELLQALDKFKDDDIDIETTETELRLKGKKTKAGIKLYSEINKELFSALGSPSGWQKLPDDFLDALNFCLFSVGNDMTKPMLTCVRCEEEFIMSSDQLRLTKKDTKDIPLDMNIPAPAAAKMKNFDIIECAETEGWLHFRTPDDLIFSTRVFEGDYPSKKALAILDSIDGEAIKLPSDLLEALDRTGIFSKETLARSISKVKITLADNELVVKGENEIGWLEESMRIRYKGPTIKFEVSPELLHDILKHTDEVVIGQNALLFSGDGFSHAICILA